MLTRLPGASVVLTCPGGEPGDNATFHWMLRSRVIGDPGSHRDRWTVVGRRLVLSSLQLSDSGNYSCYQDGHLVGTVCLLVDGELCPHSSGDSSQGGSAHSREFPA